jgi:outer membrane protein TolC
MKALNAQMDATERGLSSARRKFVIPTFFAQGILADLFSSNGLSSGAQFTVPGVPVPLTAPAISNVQWAFSVNASFNLFAGGADASKVRQESERLHQIEMERESVRTQLEAGVRQSLQHARAAYAAIDLEKRSAEAATKNYELVRRSYTQGARSITDLIDAQNLAFAANVASSASLYGFLQSYFTVLRTFGKFDVLLTDQERKETLFKLIQTEEKRI